MKKYNVNVKQAAKQLGISVNTIYARIKSGWDIDDALSVGYIPQEERIYNHKKKYDVDIKKAAEKLGLSERAIYLRLRKGWSLEKAISTPSKQGKKKTACKRAPVKPKVVLKDAGTDLRKLTEHFVNMTTDDKYKFDNACGGYKVNVFNHVNADKKEFKYNVIGTNGKCLKTNNKSEFLTFLRDEVA